MTNLNTMKKAELIALIAEKDAKIAEMESELKLANYTIDKYEKLLADSLKGNKTITPTKGNKKNAPQNPKSNKGKQNKGADKKQEKKPWLTKEEYKAQFTAEEQQAYKEKKQYEAKVAKYVKAKLAEKAKETGWMNYNKEYKPQFDAMYADIMNGKIKMEE